MSLRVAVGEGIWGGVDAPRLVSASQSGEVVGAPEEIRGAVDDEGDRPPIEKQAPAVPAGLCGTSEFGPPAPLAEEIAEQPEFAAKFAGAQRVEVIEDEKQLRWAFAEERCRLPLHHVRDGLAERGDGGRRRDPVLPLQSRRLVVKRVDDRGEQETRAVVVELDEFEAALGRTMEIPGAEKADLPAPRPGDRRRLLQRRRPPGLAAGDRVEDADKAGDFRQHGAGDDLMARRDREFPLRLGHSGCPQRRKEPLTTCGLEGQSLNLSSVAARE